MLLIIDNYDSFTYNLYQAVAGIYNNVNNINVFRNDKIDLNTVNQLKPKGIILSPGPKRPEDAGICIDLVRALATNDLPVIPLLGVCLGHQSITQAFGGNVIQAPTICHGKDDLIYHNNEGLYSGLPLPFKAARYHSLVAERETLPNCLTIEADNATKVVMGIRHKKLPIYGVQFHPESILTPEGNVLINNFLNMCK